MAIKPCAKRADCKNTDGSFTCICKTGYVGDPYSGTCTWISTVCPAGQYLIGNNFNSGCADLPLNAKESFLFQIKIIVVRLGTELSGLGNIFRFSNDGRQDASRAFIAEDHFMFGLT